MIDWIQECPTTKNWKEELSLLGLEIWRDVVRFEEYYKVSTLGRIKSKDRIRICISRRGKKYRNPSRGCLMKPIGGPDFYQEVKLCDGERGVRTRVHRIVLEAFIGPCPNGMQGCHNNGTKTDNCLENVRWDTPKNNHDDRRKHGTMYFGEACYQAKLTDEKVREMRKLRLWGWSYENIARKYSIDRSTATAAISGESWGHVK